MNTFYQNTVFLGHKPDHPLINSVYWAHYYEEDYWPVFLEDLRMRMRHNETLHTTIPTKRLRSKILDLAQQENYHAVILSEEKSLFKNEGFELSLPSEVDFILPRYREFDAAFVIGDVHGCMSQLEGLLKHSAGYPVVFVGDLVDKGPNQDEVLDCVLDLLSNKSNESAITPGNHDTSYKYRIGMNSEIRTQERSDKLDKILQYRSDWVCGPDWIVTHSPCHPKYLRKCDEKSLMRSINFRRAKSGFKDKQSIIEKMKTWGRNNSDFHIFGHVAFDDVWRYKNLIGIDTGCVYGGKLTGFFTDTKKWVSV